MFVLLSSVPTWHATQLFSSGFTVRSNSCFAVSPGGMLSSSPGPGGVSIPPTQAPSRAVAIEASNIWLRILVIPSWGRWRLVGAAAPEHDHGEAEEDEHAGAMATAGRTAAQRRPWIRRSA